MCSKLQEELQHSQKELQESQQAHRSCEDRLGMVVDRLKSRVAMQAKRIGVISLRRSDCVQMNWRLKLK